ncbi:MAG: exodeoxyribonuclease VII large subunit [Verrucomicrobiales bacterium]|nr:exodeoxyribonuclease VII large subunit [Verrucomicrobiales bacterium]
MLRKKPAQGEFGELFSAADLRQVWTVSQLTTTVKRLLESQVGRVWVTGEVTNLRAQSSGHLYFTLKDMGAQVSCVLFRGEASAARQHVQDGQKLILGGELTVYEPRGQYQLRVMTVELQGVGALQLAFEQLKKKLLAEGLFASERKRPVPKYPRCIGIATSPTGAAIKDVLHVIQRRQPSLEIVLAPCRVQGQGAAAEIASAIDQLNRLHDSGERHLDLILVTRGGGSLEDLWAFNEEILARAIHASALPVVSAVGHEIDVTISDWVADLRAATPTAAAELITEGAFSSRQFLAAIFDRMARLMRRRAALEQERFLVLCQRLSRVAPRRWVEEQSQYLDDLRESLHRAGRTQLRSREQLWQTVAGRLSRLRPSRQLTERKLQLADLRRRVQLAARARYSEDKLRFESLLDQIRMLSPLKVLERGYSITLNAATGEVLRSAHAVRAGDSVVTKLHEGEIRSTVDPAG